MEKPESVTNNDWKLLKVKYSNLKKIIKKIEQKYPVQYLIGHVDFFGYKINVNKNVLIPRFETETLVEKTIDYIKKLKLEKASLLELGTGSGCISIVLKKEIEDLNISTLDISKKALRVARKNAKLNKADITFINNDIFKFNPVNKYDILISNPPYITDKDETDYSIKYEPKLAIFAKDDGLEYYKHILSTCDKYLNKKNLIAFEIGDKQGNKLSKLAKKHFPNAKISLEKDLCDRDRFLFIINE
ncbi:MAG: peptide chain release factor N(5)-glutamine methyltransferase [Bacilli bacterium]|nr:peptide chain release factor N(5)-glutamine methyltransferase [Bacilli bacterium]